MQQKCQYLMIIELILSTTSIISELIHKVSSASQDTKNQISKTLSLMAENLERISIDLDSNRLPYGSCELLQTNIDLFIDQISQYLDAETSTLLYLDLKAIADADLLFSEKTVEATEKIKIAAGRLLAAALLVKY